MKTRQKKSSRLMAALIILILLNVIIWGYIILEGREGEVLQLWSGEDLDLQPRGEFNSLWPEPAGDEPDEPDRFQLHIEGEEAEQP